MAIQHNDHDEDDGDNGTTSVSYPCPRCDKRYKTKKLLDRHLLTHKQQKHACNSCSQSFSTSRGLAQHTSRQHAPKNFSCKLCVRHFKDKSSLQRHEKEHDGKKFVCTTCQRLFSTDEELQSHITKDHTVPHKAYTPVQNAPNKLKPYKCSRCEKWFKDADATREHERQTHDAVATQCRVCSKTFKNQKILNEHMVRHGNKDFVCSKCAASFFTKGERDRHEKLAHITEPLAQTATEANVPQDRTAAEVEVTQGQGDTEERVIQDEATAGEPLTQDVENSDDDSDTSGASSEQYLQKQRILLFGNEAIERLRNVLDDLYDKVEHSLFTTLPETPSPGQQAFMGRNLRAFEHSQLIEPLPTLVPPTLDPSKNLLHLLKQPPRRSLYTSLLKNKGDECYAILRVQNFQGTIPKARSDEFHDMDVVRFKLDRSAAVEVARFSRMLLERVPVLLRELSDNHRYWILNAAKRLAFDNDKNLSNILPVPEYKTYREQGGERYYVVFRVSGYDHTKCYPWNKQINIPLSAQMDANVVINVPNEANIVWKGESGIIPPQALTQYSQVEFAQAMQLAKQFTALYSGFIGSFDDCKADALVRMSDFTAGGSKPTSRPRKYDTNLAPLSSAWSGEPVWICEKKATYTVFAPSGWLLHRMQGAPSYHIVYTIEPARLYPVGEGMLQAVLKGCNADTVWGIGAALADEANRCGKERAPLIAACTDTKHIEELHVCADCLKLKAHCHFKITEHRYYPICRDCVDLLSGLYTSSNIKGGVVGHHLLVHFKRENDIFSKQETRSQLRQKTNDAIDALSYMFAPDGVLCYDGYVDSVLDPRRNKPPTWDGTKIHPVVPSIDAVDPIVAGNDGLTHYHYFDDKTNNIVICGDWINRMKAHHQVVTLHAVLLFSESIDRGREAYEKAIAIMRNCLINHYEYGIFGHAQQSHRVGKPIPDNMAAITRSFRTAELLHRTKSNEQVWRLYSTRPLGSLSQRASWRPPQVDWLLTQLGYIETEVFGDEASLYRGHWMQQGADGENVFWPFSQYSVSVDCTWWSLWEIFAVKDIRNVTCCQLPATWPKMLPFYYIEEVFLVIANLWIRMVKKDVDQKLPSYDLGRDQSGLIPHPNINTLLCASLGHRVAGEIQLTGLRNFDMSKSDKVIFDAEKCGFLWETQFTNWMKFKYKESTFNETLPLLRKIRRNNLLQRETRNLLPQNDLNIQLRDELATTVAVEIPRIGHDSVFPVVIDPPTFRRLLNGLAKQQTEEGTQRDHAVAALSKHREVETSTETGPIPTSPSDETGIDNTFSADTNLEDRGIPAISYDPPTDAAKCCQMSNLSATCYMSSIIHTVANTAEVMHTLQSLPKLISVTGRDPRILQGRDPTGSKHIRLLNVFMTISQDLQIEGPSLGMDRTQELLAASKNLRPQWDNNNDDAADYFSFLMEAIDVMSDQSPASMQPDVNEKQDSAGWVQRPAYTPEELLHQKHMVDLSAGIPLESLQDHAEQHWKSHCLSGHQSDFADATTIQTVYLTQCGSIQCPIVMREFHYSNQIHLQFPHDLSSDEPLPLERLMEQCFLEQLDPAPTCPNRELHKVQDDGRLSRRVKRIAKTGDIFAVEIDRTRAPPPLPQGLSQSEIATFFQKAADNPFLNRVSDFEFVDMEKWANGRDVWEKAHLGESGPRTEELLIPASHQVYQVCGIVAYSRKLFHYTAFVKIEGEWTYFDDLQAYPVVKDPFDHWPEGFVERLLLYRRIPTTGDTVQPIGQSVESEQHVSNKEAMLSYPHASGDVEASSSQSHADARHQSLEDRNTQIRSEKTQLELENARLKSEIVQLKSEDVQSKSEIAQLKSEVAQLKLNNEQLRTRPDAQHGTATQVLSDPTMTVDRWLHALPTFSSREDLLKLIHVLGSIISKMPFGKTEDVGSAEADAQTSDADPPVVQEKSKKKRITTPFGLLASGFKSGFFKESQQSELVEPQQTEEAVKRRRSLGNLLGIAPSSKTTKLEHTTSLSAPATDPSVSDLTRPATPKAKSGMAESELPRTPTPKAKGRSFADLMPRIRRRRSVKRPAPIKIVEPKHVLEDDAPKTASIASEDEGLPPSPVPPPTIDRKADRRRDKLLASAKADAEKLARSTNRPLVDTSTKTGVKRKLDRSGTKQTEEEATKSTSGAQEESRLYVPRPPTYASQSRVTLSLTSSIEERSDDGSAGEAMEEDEGNESATSP